jgi:hypothetical protein
MTDRSRQGWHGVWDYSSVLGGRQAAPSAVVWSGHAPPGARFSANPAS